MAEVDHDVAAAATRLPDSPQAGSAAVRSEQKDGRGQRGSSDGAHDARALPGLNSEQRDDVSGLTDDNSMKANAHAPLSAVRLAHQPMPTPAIEAEDIEISVHTPLKHDGHVVYTVTTKVFITATPKLYIWLREQMCFQQRGYIIPPLPPKHNTTLNKFDPAFLETRRHGLERAFLTLRSHELMTFQKEKERRGMDKLRESINSMVSRMKGVSAALQDYSLATANAMQSMGELAVGFEAMRESDPELKTVVECLAQALSGTKTESMATLKIIKAEVVEPLQDYLEYPAAVMQTLRYREVMQAHHDDIAVELEQRTQELAREKEPSTKPSSFSVMFSQKSPEQVKQERVEQLQEQVDQLHTQTERAWTESTKIDGHVIAQYTKFEEDKDRDIRSRLQHWAALERQRHEKVCDMWSECIGSLEAALEAENP
ncbi:uncharacterized protein MONBRDRAFT_33742 [Monosiga brevicollis MX1]|uniref:PX domain-containing protein n=1 Tax=Monosiga brevicollis TaxID=81824 RepID=A9V772_MONBE|nr:uncharacterized protein MONBRDRAFT_33742 [Monosiga brevicollis MX1]EDQ86739.1 predicted protein [Monosiga brevicollis MX1]|eukprot:XP_001748575.1 hypothetical protein [Monosiga brevicollis MX1]